MSWEPEVVIDAARLRSNRAWLRESSGQRIAPVLKSNGYGHGLQQSIEVLSDQAADAPFIAVADPEDALEARKFTDLPLLCMGPAPAEVLMQFSAQRIFCSLTSPATAQIWCDMPPADRPEAHVLVDTGLGRLGLTVHEVRSQLVPMLESRNLTIQGFFIHPASADTGNVDSVDAETSEALQLAEELRAAGLLQGLTHLGASSTLFLDLASRGDVTRAGIGLFGYLQEHFTQKGQLQPALSVYATVVHTKQVAPGELFGYSGQQNLPEGGTVATINFGVSHGLNPKSEHRWFVSVGGSPALVLESTLDYSMVGPVPEAVQVGDRVLVMGGRLPEYSVESHAAMLEIIPDHVLAALSPRLRRTVTEDVVQR